MKPQVMWAVVLGETVIAAHKHKLDADASFRSFRQSNTNYNFRIAKVQVTELEATHDK